MVHEEAHSKTEHDDARPAIIDTTPREFEKKPEVSINVTVDTEDYSVWTVGERRAIVVAASFAAWFSPMTGSIYFPALMQISKDLRVSAAAINLTVTTYLIVQGLAPMMIAGFSDRAGRRPAYIVCFTIYIIANLALSLQNNYTALLILRMVQAAGSSGTVALANGVVGDITTTAERGAYVAWATVGTILGPSLSPVLGGVISEYLDWHWIFWFLLILSVVFAVPFLLLMPETCRAVVHDGSIPPPWTSWNLTDRIRFRRRARRGILVDEEKLQLTRKNYKLQMPNPMDTLKVLVSKEVIALLLSTGLAMALYYALLTGASEVFLNLYGYDQLDVGLIFISIGAGSIISAFTTGKLIDWNYRRHAERLGMPVKKNKQTDLLKFPIEKARIDVAMPLLLLTAVTLVIYGWMMTRKVWIGGPVVMLFLAGYCLIAGTQCLVVVMVDIYPGAPAAATAANNVVRCLLGAAASAAIEPMSAAMGYGWAYTVLCLIFVLSLPGLAVTSRCGIRWRARAKTRADRKKELRG